jgi:hypothetical protein
MDDITYQYLATLIKRVRAVESDPHCLIGLPLLNTIISDSEVFWEPCPSSIHLLPIL